MENKQWKGLPIVIIGQGGLGKKIQATLNEINKQAKNSVYNFLGYLDDSEELKNKELYLGNINFLEKLAKNEIIGVAIGIGNPIIKRKIIDQISHIKNIVFPNIIHPNVFIYDDFKMGLGNIIASGVNICTNVEIGNFNFINLSSTIGHDTLIKNYCVINPLSSISGNILIKDEVFIGTGANLLQEIIIEERVVIGAGSVILKNCIKDRKYVGIPGKELK